MTTLTVGKEVETILRQTQDLAEIRDGQGQIIGFFAPVSLEHAARYAQAATMIDRAEIQRRRAIPGKSYTTKEVFEHLLSMTTDEKMRQDLQRKIEVQVERDRCAGQ